ncbi:SH3 domain-protein [Pseudoneurospora amorphoporcata]|uniref:SH3 domain-protein n=1 Tax=Pseudoneurospora amorphoporcata TaxID=241081 RepID=A0AAN6NYN6_9PEZI|nr:SH3 domain-protein [Pseudoneurospora amorphoporcata]
MIQLGEKHDVRLELRIPGPRLDESNSLDSASKKVVAVGAAKGGAQRQKSPPTNITKRINHISAKRKVSRRQSSTKALLFTFLSAVPTAMSQCVPLKGSTACSAWQVSSISTDEDLVKLYPFLKDVKDTTTFDEQLKSYVQTNYVQLKFQNLFGCGGIKLTNTTELYARFATTVLCNGVIQNSVVKCNLSAANSRPICADTCAQYAISEANIVVDSARCEHPNDNYLDQVRADFTTCALPADSLSGGECISGIANEPDNCGFGGSLLGMCGYCKSGGPNATDTCCYNSDAEARCANVVLPSNSPSITLDPVPSATSTSEPVTDPGSKKGLSGGAIAGIVVGAVVGLALLALLVFACIFLRRRRRHGSQDGSILNQPTPARKGPSTAQMTQNDGLNHGFAGPLGGRIARMSALEGDAPSPRSHRDFSSGSGEKTAAAYAVGRTSRRRGDDYSSSDGYRDSPISDRGIGILRPPPTMKRSGSLSSGSVLAGEDGVSPMSSPQGGVASQQSEQLPFFKDYYSQDEIHPGDKVAALWAYQPRATDEFALERGDMLKVVGIWDDGWATGVMVDETAEEWESRRQAQRDSGVSNTSGKMRDVSPPVSGEIKAFPLVCVCLPEHWRRTIEGDGSTETGESAQHQL